MLTRYTIDNQYIKLGVRSDQVLCDINKTDHFLNTSKTIYYEQQSRKNLRWKR